MKFDQSLPLIYVLVLVTSPKTPTEVSEFQCSFRLGERGGGVSAMAATVKLK